MCDDVSVDIQLMRCGDGIDGRDIGKRGSKGESFSEGVWRQ